MPTHNIGGITYFPVTPLNDSGEISEDRLRDRLQHVYTSDFSSVFPLGSLGEFPYFTDEERKRIMEIVVDEIGGDLPVFPGCHAISTKEAVDYAQYAEDIGADGVFINIFSYYKLNNDEIYNHYKSINNSINIPICVYDNPFTTGVEINFPLVKRLSELEKVEYYKTGTPNLQSYRNTFSELKNQMTIFAAPVHVFEKMAFGAHGWTGAIPSISPDTANEIFNDLQNGDLASARQTYAEIRPILEFFYDDHLAVVMKTILSLQGHEVGDPRPPLQPLSEDKRLEIEKTMEHIGLI